MRSTVNEPDPAEDLAFPRISALDPDETAAPEPPDVDGSAAADDDLVEADAPEPEQITDIEIGVD